MVQMEITIILYMMMMMRPPSCKYLQWVQNILAWAAGDKPENENNIPLEVNCIKINFPW